jgi:hypothetical protein
MHVVGVDRICVSCSVVACSAVVDDHNKRKIFCDFSIDHRRHLFRPTSQQVAEAHLTKKIIAPIQSRQSPLLARLLGCARNSSSTVIAFR